MKVVAVIPARYGSTRLKAKVLARQTGKFLVQHTYEQAILAKTPQKVLIAADSAEVVSACKSFGAECVLTSPAHKSGTDRTAEAVRDIDADIVVNLQADEPEIEPDYIDYLVQLLVDEPDADMATLAAEFEYSDRIADANIVKVVIDKNWRAIYFSRSPIPYDRNAGGVGDVKCYLRHLGIYAYKRRFLAGFAALPEGMLEACEKLEQLRAIENGFKIIVGKVAHGWDGIDTPAQYDAFVKRYTKSNT